MTCGAATDYLCLPVCIEKMLEVIFWILWFTFEIEKYNTLFSSGKIYILFPLFGQIYRQVDEHGGLISIWLFVVMLFDTCVLILTLIFMYKKCFHEKVKVYFDERLADCCGNKNVMTSSLSVVENGLVSWEHDEIVRSKLGR